MFLAFVICWTKYLSTVRRTSRVIVRPAIVRSCQIELLVEAPVGKNMRPAIRIGTEKYIYLAPKFEELAY